MAKAARISFIASLCAALATLVISPAFAAPTTRTAVAIKQIHQPPSPRGAKTKAIKAAVVLLAKALRSDGLSAVLTYVRNNGTKEAAAIIGKHAATIAGALDGLAAWEELSMLMVRGQVEGALRNARVTESNAKVAAYWIEQVLSGLFL